mgnify:CR=1 FL=1
MGSPRGTTERDRTLERYSLIGANNLILSPVSSEAGTEIFKGGNTHDLNDNVPAYDVMQTDS